MLIEKRKFIWCVFVLLNIFWVKINKFNISISNMFVFVVYCRVVGRYLVLDKN